MSITSYPAVGYDGLEVLCDEDNHQVVGLWIAETASQSARPPEERVLNGIHPILLRASLKSLEGQDEFDYTDALMAFHLYLRLLDPTSQLHIRRQRDSYGDLRRRKRLLLRNPRIRSMASAEIIATSQGTGAVESTVGIEKLAWNFYFPNLPYYQDIDVTAQDLQDFKREMLEGWKTHAKAENSAPSLGEVLEHQFAEASDGKDKERLRQFCDWLAFAVHHVPVVVHRAVTAMIAGTSIAVSDLAEKQVRFLYGPHPLFGGGNLYFLARVLDRDTVLKGLLLDVIETKAHTEKQGFCPDEKAALHLMFMMYLQLEIADLDRERKRSPRQPIEVQADQVCTGGADSNESAITLEHKMIVEQLVSKLTRPDQILFLAHREGLKPKEIASKYPDLGMSAKQISDRFRKVLSSLRIKAGKQTKD